MTAINVAEFATELNTDARTARKFLRSITPIESQPGKGSRWSIEKKDLRSLKSKFAKFEAQVAIKAEKPQAAPEDANDADTDLEPTDDELALIDAE